MAAVTTAVATTAAGVYSSNKAAKSADKANKANQAQAAAAAAAQAENRAAAQANIDAINEEGIAYTDEIMADPSAFLDSRNINNANAMTYIDPETEGTLINGDDHRIDIDGVNATLASASVDTAAKVAKPNEVANYTAAKSLDQVEANQATAATMETNKDALVDIEEHSLDMQGLGTGRNADGSINHTGEALSNFATQNISSVIDTTTMAGKMLAQTLGEGNYVDAKATVTGQLEILTGEFTDPVTGEPKIPTWAAGIARSVSKNIAFKGITGTAATATLAQAMIEATLPIAQAESEFYQTLTLENLDNKQEMIINKANVLSKMELADLDNRTALSVNNAKMFMTYDMANLSNEQQTEIINTQAKVQSILEDTKQVNVQRRFGAESQNNMDQFYDNLGATIDMYNTSQRNHMSEINMTEANDMSQFNSSLENSREQFYANMQYSIDAANATWRQNVTTTNTQVANNAAARDVQNLLNITNEAMNQMWDRQDSLLDHNYSIMGSSASSQASIEQSRIAANASIQNANASRPSAGSQILGAMGTMVGNYAGSEDGAAQISSALGKAGDVVSGIGSSVMGFFGGGSKTPTT